MTQSTKHSTHLFILAIIIAAGLTTNAQDWKSEKRINVLFGLAQPVLASGFNIEGNYIHKRFIFDYSHGASLDFSGKTVTSDLRGQGIAVHEPWTTGFGVGYRIKEWINVRVEPKWHRFEFYYDGEQQNKNSQITAYNTFSLGLGVYGSYRPFKNKNNYLKGILIAPSIRFWPTVSSGLKGDGFTYLNKKTNAIEKIKTLDPGTGFTPVVINVSVGYSFQLKREYNARYDQGYRFQNGSAYRNPDFFEQMLNLTIKEESPRHFVVHSKGIRLVFLQAMDSFEVEMYVSAADVPKTYKDPNGITVIVTDKNSTTKQ